LKLETENFPGNRPSDHQIKKPLRSINLLCLNHHAPTNQVLAGTGKRIQDMEKGYYFLGADSSPGFSTGMGLVIRT